MINKVEICGVNTSKLKVLKESEKLQLLGRIKEGDKEARNLLVNGNLRLVLSVVQKFTNRGENLDDLFQVGCIGLIKSIDNFDTGQGVRFSTYAVPIDVICREYPKGDIHMTRKQALHKALEVVTDEETKEKIAEILSELPFTGWSEKTIFDSIDQFIIDHGRTPTVTDFKKKGLPPHPVIKLRFNKTLREFLDSHYPTQKLCDSKIFGSKSREEWQELFISEYHRIKPSSAEEYNTHRQKGNPSWATVARLFNITKWLDWLLFCNIVPYVRKREPNRGRAHSTPITIKSVARLNPKGGKYAYVTKDDDGRPWYCDAEGNLTCPVFRTQEEIFAQYPFVKEWAEARGVTVCDPIPDIFLE